MSKPITAFIGVGSNLGSRRFNIEKSITHLDSCPGVHVIGVSPIYETQPVGGPPQGPFFNGVVKIKTTLSPRDLLTALLNIEKKMGRVRKNKWGPRLIDLDILFYGQKIIRQKNLKIPHPHLPERRFVLKPFAELAPRARHPVLRKTIRRLDSELTGIDQKVTIKFLWKKSRFQGLSKRKKTRRPSSP